MSANDRSLDPGGWRRWRTAKNSGGLPLLFLLFICLPLLDRVIHFSRPLEIVEKRKLAEKPVFAAGRPFDYLKQYDPYYNDHFAFRTRWIHWNSLLAYKLFKASATPRVVVGKQGWLFMGNINPYFNEVDYYRNLKPFTAGELRYWRILLEERRNWLRRRGIHYLFVVAPCKSTIYPELMPGSIKKIHPHSRLEQLIDYLGQHSTLNVLDLRPALWQAKKTRAAYYRTDSHWNDWGGYVAYREIINRLRDHFPAARPRSLDDYRLQRAEFRNGDLALMLTLPNIFWENKWQIQAKAPLRARVIRGQEQKSLDRFANISVHACSTGPLPAALMVHDSFAFSLKQFLSEDFAKTIYVWNWGLNFFPAIIQSEGVRIVIDEMAEYSLLQRFPGNPPELHKRFQ
jgi:hypothetical protein